MCRSGCGISPTTRPVVSQTAATLATEPFELWAMVKGPDGAPYVIDATTKTVYRIDLKRSSALWLDSTLATTEITATVRYDNLTRVYHVTRMQDGRIERAETTEREEDARARLTTDFDKLPLFSSAALEANSEYYVRVRAHTTPRNASFLWPWERHDVTGQAKFTFVQ